MNVRSTVSYVLSCCTGISDFIICQQFWVRRGNGAAFGIGIWNKATDFVLVAMFNTSIAKQ